MLVVTNDVDEAIILADRIVPLEHGPSARLGPSFAVDLPRPRLRENAVKDPRWRRLHGAVVEFLRESARTKRGNAAQTRSAPLTRGSLVEVGS